MKPVGPQGLPYNGGVPRHWACRSAEIPITYTWEELGIEGIGETRAVVEGGQRASMFGPTAHRTFDSWLKSLTPSEQDAVLGSQRLGAALRAGKLTSVKQMVDAATGRPLSLGEMHDMGLVGPRWRGKDTWGAYGSPDELRQAILDDFADPNSAVHAMNAEIERLEIDLIDLQIKERNHFDKNVAETLSPDELKELRQKIKDQKQTIKLLKDEERTYFCRKYLYDITPGKLDLTGRFEIEKGLNPVARDAVERGMEIYQNLIGSESHLSNVFRRRVDGEYWYKVPETSTTGKLTYAEKWFTRPNQKPTIRFESSPKNSDFIGGGPWAQIRIGEPCIEDVVHEMGHWFEATSSKTVRQVVDYLRRRVGEDEWGNPVPFADNPHGKAEYPHQITKFIRSYQGAIYTGRSQWLKPSLTEFFSVGLEQMTINTVEFIRTDPETFDFLLHLLAGREWR